MEISSGSHPVEALTKLRPASLAGVAGCGLCGITHGDNSGLSLSSVTVYIGISEFFCKNCKCRGAPQMATRNSKRNSKRNSERNSKRSGKRIPFGEETGVHAQRVDLPNPDPEAPRQTEEQPLLPNERDETTRPTSTGLGTSNEQSREVVEQAREDTEHGLQDTDLRGIPSNIVAPDLSSSDKKNKK